MHDTRGYSLGPIKEHVMGWALDTGAKASREDRHAAGAGAAGAGAAGLGQAGRLQAAG